VSSRKKEDDIVELKQGARQCEVTQGEREGGRAKGEKLATLIEIDT
jgi:hypothetical protein